MTAFRHQEANMTRTKMQAMKCSWMDKWDMLRVCVHLGILPEEGWEIYDTYYHEVYMEGEDAEMFQLAAALGQLT